MMGNKVSFRQQQENELEGIQSISEDDLREKKHGNVCELHSCSEDLYFPTVGRKIRRGSCLGHSQNGCTSFSGIDSESGQLVFITEWNFKYSQLESKCTLNCKSDPGKCNGHTLGSIISGIEAEVMYLSQIRHKNLVSYEAVLCLRRKEGVIIYLVQDFVIGTNVNSISNSLGWSYSCVSIIAKGILDALIYLHNKGISHSNIDDFSVFMDNSGTCRVTDFSFISYLNYLMGGSKAGKQIGDDLPALGHLIESLLQLPNPDMVDFIEQCKSERTLTASDLLEHPFLSSECKKASPNCLPEEKIVTDLPMHKSIMTSERSRLETDFEVQQELGEGAYGDVLKVKNILDNRQYAIKRIPLTARSQKISRKITREVELLSRLHHENVVRYYSSWIEDANSADSGIFAQIDSATGSNESYTESDNQVHTHGIKKPDELSNNDDFSSDGIEFVNSGGQVIEGDDENAENGDEESQASNQQVARSEKNEQNMYIQMEVCENSTLRIAIDNHLCTDSARLWRLFREITKGLAYIHSQDVIHRDLKPANIFLNSRGQVKIGDFGLATTSSLALQPNHEVASSHRRGVIISSATGEVGTALYVAPELKGKASDSQYNQKADLYSLGIIFFEMCHPPFSTGMERIETLTALRSPEVTIPNWMENDLNYSRKVKIIKWLLNHDQNKRPSAEELLLSSLIPLTPLEPDETEEILRYVLGDPQIQERVRRFLSLTSSQRRGIGGRLGY